MTRSYLSRRCKCADSWFGSSGQMRRNNPRIWTNNLLHLATLY
uniref:Uncharacterized protein n=1 Tax=Anguilla anguilla TaxID=7936 RepID=A0A0E9UEU6_ANGAN